MRRDPEIPASPLIGWNLTGKHSHTPFFSNMQVNDTFPEGVELKYIPINLQESPLACSIPTVLKIDQQLAKLTSDHDKILIVSVPGAFTPTCTENHIPPYLANAEKLRRDHNVKLLIVLSANDAFVLNAWGKLLLTEGGISSSEGIVFALDPNAAFARAQGLSQDATSAGMGVRTARFALVVGKDRKVQYLGVETQRGVSVLGYDAVKAKL